MRTSISIVLVLSLVLSCVVAPSYADDDLHVYESDSFAAKKYNATDYTDSFKMAIRLNSLFEEYEPNNSYFTSTPNGYNKRGNKSMPCHRTLNGGYAYGSFSRCGYFDGKMQCMGYAMYSQYVLFGKTESGKTDTSVSGASQIKYTRASNPTKQQIISMPLGTHIRNHSPYHSVILIKADNNTITYIDANCASTWGCAVHLHTVNWNYFFSYYGIGSSRVYGYASYPTAATYPKDEPYGKTPFVDIGYHWAKNTIEKAYTQKLVSGVSQTRFDPEGNITRAMFVQMLYNLAGKPEADLSSFSDVHPTLWYAKSIGWAEKMGIASGWGDGMFRPNWLLTREQAVQMLYSAMLSTGAIVPEDNKSLLDKFPDSSSLSYWAEDAMLWALDNEIIKGKSSGQLAPNVTMSRAEAVTILMRYADYDPPMPEPEINFPEAAILLMQE